MFQTSENLVTFVIYLYSKFESKELQSTDCVSVFIKERCIINKQLLNGLSEDV